MNTVMQSATKPTAQPTAQPEQVIAEPNIPPLSPHGAVPAPVSTQTGASVIAASQQQSIAHNSLVRANSGGKKRSKKAKAKRSKKAKSKRSKKAKAKRSKKAKAKRSRRGGADPTPTPTNTTTTTKLVTVPQFLGNQHAGANQASINLNHGGMLMSSQAAYDNVNGPASNHHLP
jgi:hypothetical protein